MTALIILVVANAVLAFFGVWLVQQNHQAYYEEIGSPNYGFSGPAMITFMFGHVLIFQYVGKTNGVTRIVLITWSVVLWAMLVQMFRHMLG